MVKEQDTSIRVQNINKTFKLPHEKVSSLKGLFLNMFNGKRTYENQRVLKDISFEIKKGEFFGIVGRNGSGKSTLLKLLAGIYSPDSGSIHINGKLTPFIELGVGFNPELTGRENVFLNGALLGFNRKEMLAMYEEIVEFAELENFMDQKLKNYSSGMQVRLAFSIAIRAKTEILLVDEVLAVGDSAFQQKCFKVFDDIKSSGRTVIFISHDSGAVERFCDRAMLVEKGVIKNIGKPKEIVYEYAALLANEEFEENSKSKEKSDKGTGLLSIGKVSVLSKGRSTNALKAGDAFSVSIQVAHRSKEKEKIVVGLDIIDEQGISILGPNTREIKLDITSQNDMVVVSEFMSNPLSPGSYSVTVGVFNESATIAHSLVENATGFKVIGEPRHGKIYIEPRWSIVKNTK